MKRHRLMIGKTMVMLTKSMLTLLLKLTENLKIEKILFVAKVLLGINM